MKSFKAVERKKEGKVANQLHFKGVGITTTGYTAGHQLPVYYPLLYTTMAKRTITIPPKWWLQMTRVTLEMQILPHACNNVRILCVVYAAQCW